MLPSPAMRFWSSRADFSGAREPANSFAEPRGVEFGRERLGAQSAHPRMLVERLGRREVHEAEAPRVVIGDDPSVIEDENDVIVLRIFRPLVMELAGR